MSTGTADQAVIEFSDLDGFYAARGGERPPEFDYGCHNVDDLAVNPVDPRPQPSWLRYRVSYVGQTGDFYAIALVGGLTAEGRVILLGSLGAGHVEKDVYAHFADWAEGEGLGRPLSWFIERIKSFVPKPKADSPLSPVVVRFDNIASFYAARGGRFSGESNYGVYNKNDMGLDLQAQAPVPESGLVFVPFGEPDYRVSHVHDTGDFYAVENRFDSTAQVLLLGSVGPGTALGKVDEHLVDWARGDGPGRPFSWFVERIASFPRE